MFAHLCLGYVRILAAHFFHFFHQKMHNAHIPKVSNTIKKEKKTTVQVGIPAIALVSPNNLHLLSSKAFCCKCMIRANLCFV